LLLSRCVFTVAGVSVVSRIPAAAGVLAIAVGPAIVGVLAVVGDSVVVGFPAFASLLALPSLLLLCLCCGWLPCYCFPAYLYVTSALLLFFALAIFDVAALLFSVQGFGSALINADPDTDPDPAFFLIADPDPGFDDLKLKKIYSWKFNFYFLDQNMQFTYP
jgi:hypothetical protein